MDDVTPEELRSGAERVFADRHGEHTPRARMDHETIVAEIPCALGIILRVSWFERSKRVPAPTVGFRLWQVRPDGGQFPFRGLGFTVGAELIPHIASAAAKLLDLAAEDRDRLPHWALPHDTRGRR